MAGKSDSELSEQRDPLKLLQQAEKALSNAGKWSFFGSKQDRYEEAAQQFVNAGNAFKFKEMANDAGKAYEEAAKIQRQWSDFDEVASLKEAFESYSKVNLDAAVKCSTRIASIYESQGKARLTGEWLGKMAKLYEDSGDNKAAAETYKEAAKKCGLDSNSKSATRSHKLKFAELTALNGDYYVATQAFEEVAQACVNDNLMMYSIKDYLFKAGICQLCTGDEVSASSALDRYRELDPGFTQLREHHLLVDLLQAVKDGDQDLFSDRLFQYDQVSKLDSWKTTMLLRIKSAIENKEEDFS